MSSIHTITKFKICCKLKKTDFYNIFLNLTLLLLTTALILLILDPQKYISSINSGINLFFVSVFPSLLPFLFLSKIIDGLGGFRKIDKLMTPLTAKLYHCPSVANYPFIMSMVSGYPIGAKIVGELSSSRLLNSKEAKKVIALSSTSGPIFVIGSVGANMIGSPFVGGLIFISHILGSLITALFFTRNKKNTPASHESAPPVTQTNLLASSTTSTISAILTVAVYVSIFYMFIDMAYSLGFLKFTTSIIGKFLTAIGVSPALATGLSSGLIEMTRGCKEIALLGSNLASLVCCTGLISFGGLSIILQSLTFLSGSGVKTSYFILLKIVQAIISSLVAFAVGLIFL